MHTGEKFLRLLIREWKTSYDPEFNLLQKDKKKSGVDDTPKGLEYEI